MPDMCSKGKSSFKIIKPAQVPKEGLGHVGHVQVEALGQAQPSDLTLRAGGFTSSWISSPICNAQRVTIMDKLLQKSDICPTIAQGFLDFQTEPLDVGQTLVSWAAPLDTSWTNADLPGRQPGQSSVTKP